MAEAPHLFGIRVYYEDTDFSGVVYHASYLRFLERGRTELLRARGIEQADLAESGTGLPLAFAVRHMTIDFIKPARMDDELWVATRVTHCGGASLIIGQRIMRGDELLIDASVKIVLVGGGRAKRLPGSIVQRLWSAPELAQQASPSVG